MDACRLRSGQLWGLQKEGAQGQREPEGGVKLEGRLAWRRAELCRTGEKPRRGKEHSVGGGEGLRQPGRRRRGAGLQAAAAWTGVWPRGPGGPAVICDKALGRPSMVSPAWAPGDGGTRRQRWGSSWQGSLGHGVPEGPPQWG